MAGRAGLAGSQLPPPEAGTQGADQAGLSREPSEGAWSGEGWAGPRRAPAPSGAARLPARWSVLTPERSRAQGRGERGTGHPEGPPPAHPDHSPQQPGRRSGEDSPCPPPLTPGLAGGVRSQGSQIRGHVYPGPRSLRPGPQDPPIQKAVGGPHQVPDGSRRGDRSGRVLCPFLGSVGKEVSRYFSD